MAELRPYWKGYLKLSLVTCPVAMTPATSDSEKVRFHTLNRDTGNRVVSQYVDSVTGKPVKRKNEARGYERGENDHVILTDEDLEAVKLDTVRTIDIEQFVPRGSIEWIYLETPFYLTANDKIGDEAFAVIRQAMQAEDVVGVSRLVLGRRERAIVLEPRGDGIVLWALRFGDEVRAEDDYFDGIEEKPDAKGVSTIAAFIEKRMKDWSSEMVADPIQESLLKLIARKKKARKTSKAKTSKAKTSRPETKGGAEKSNVIDIMDALKKAVAKELKSRKAG